MKDIILKTLITFFCMYGFVEFLRNIVGFFLSKDNPHKNCVIVIKVLNCEKTLEGTIRIIIWKSLSLSHGGFAPNITIVDMGSSDSTADIAQRLSNDYSFINYLTYEEYLKNKGKKS